VLGGATPTSGTVTRYTSGLKRQAMRQIGEPVREALRDRFDIPLHLLAGERRDRSRRRRLSITGGVGTASRRLCLANVTKVTSWASDLEDTQVT
jgi:hypothetical protein